MRWNQRPTICWQQQGHTGEDRQHSLVITLLRGIAALQVALAHLRAEMYPSVRAIADPPLYYEALAFATGFAHLAVVLFFLVSGWLVGGSLLNKFAQPHSIRSYAVDRVTRLWTVLLPSFVLMLLAAMAIGAVSAAHSVFSASNEYSALSFVGNLFGLQTVVLNNFGGNYSLWSLANESWYYVLFPLLLLVLNGRGWPRAASLVAIFTIAALLPYAITLYFSIWLLGALFSRIRIDCGNAARGALAALTACTWVYFRFTGSNDDLNAASFVQDLICSLPFLALLSTLNARLDPASRPLRRLGAVAGLLSSFSFTLYILHVPTIFLLRYVCRIQFGRDHLAPGAPLDCALYFVMAAIVVTLSYLAYLLFESHTFRIRRLVKRALLRRRPASVPAVVMPAE